MKLGRAQPWRFVQLLRMPEVDPNEHAAAIDLLLTRPGGLNAILVAMHGRLLQRRPRRTPMSDAEKDIAKRTIGSVRFEEMKPHEDHCLADLVNACLDQPSAADVAATLCSRLAQALTNHSVGGRSFDELLRALVKKQLRAVLDEFSTRPDDVLGRTLLQAQVGSRRSPILDAADHEQLLAWIAEDRNSRGPFVARHVTVWRRPAEGAITWSPIAESLVSAASEKQPVLDAMANSFLPLVWGGSLEETLRPYRELAEQLRGDADPLVAAWAAAQVTRLTLRAADDIPRRRQSDESFE